MFSVCNFCFPSFFMLLTLACNLQCRKLGWAHHLVCGWRSLARGLAFFMVTVQLTEAGERHSDQVVKQVFQYIQMLRGETWKTKCSSR